MSIKGTFELEEAEKPGGSPELVLAQYTSLRNEIMGHQRDEATMLTATLTVTGALITIAALQSLVGLLIIPPIFLYVTWRKMIAGTVNTFRIVAFLKAYYEETPPDARLCWERALEIDRDRREYPEQRLAWGNANAKVIRMLVGVTIVAALIVFLKAAAENWDLATRVRSDYCVAQRDCFKIGYGGPKSTTQRTESTNATLISPASVPAKTTSAAVDKVDEHSPTRLSQLLRDVEAAKVQSEQGIVWRWCFSVGGLLGVLVACSCVLWATHGDGARVGGKEWRLRASNRMREIKDLLSKPHSPPS